MKIMGFLKIKAKTVKITKQITNRKVCDFHLLNCSYQFYIEMSVIS